MTLRNRGSIVNTASIGGLLGDFRGTLYGAAKASVIGLTRYIASQYGKLGIRCNAVAPGLVLTPASTRSLPENVRSVFRKYNAVDYLGQAADIAATIAFLASDDARYVTGQTITADGGMDSHNPTGSRTGRPIRKRHSVQHSRPTQDDRPYPGSIPRQPIQTNKVRHTQKRRSPYSMRITARKCNERRSRRTQPRFRS